MNDNIFNNNIKKLQKNKYNFRAVNKLKDLGYNPKFVEVNISKGRILDRGIMMISENPIAIITAKKRG